MPCSRALTLLRRDEFQRQPCMRTVARTVILLLRVSCGALYIVSILFLAVHPVKCVYSNAFHPNKMPFIYIRCNSSRNNSSTVMLKSYSMVDARIFNLPAKYGQREKSLEKKQFFRVFCFAPNAKMGATCLPSEDLAVHPRMWRKLRDRSASQQ